MEGGPVRVFLSLSLLRSRFSNILVITGLNHVLRRTLLFEIIGPSNIHY